MISEETHAGGDTNHTLFTMADYDDRWAAAPPRGGDGSAPHSPFA